MTNYSARHWAEVAKQEADRATQGGGQVDSKVFARKLDDSLHQEVSDFGTYNGQEVQSGEVFVGQDGRLWQYTKQQEDNPQGLVWESISQNTPASSDFPVLGLDDGLGRIVIPHIDSQYVTISDDYGHNWRREFLNTKFSGTAGSIVAKYHNNVVHTGTQYVYFGTQSTMVSQDGIEWHSGSDYKDATWYTNIVLQNVTGAAYINGVCVLSDSSGQVYYSTDDGWTLTKSSITDGRITMSPGNFVLCVRGSASTTSGELLSISYNGIDWITRSPSGSFGAPETQAVSNGMTIVQCAPCYSEVSEINVSLDEGLSWHTVSLPFICQPRLSYTGGKFIILQNDEQTDVFLWSEDGLTWNTEYLMALGTWRTVCFSAGVWSFLGDLDTIVASSWNTGSSTGSTYHNLQLLSYNEADIHMLLQQTGLEASKVDMLTAYNLQTVLFREEGTVYIANDTFNYEPIGQTGLYSQIYRGHIYKLQSDDNGLMRLIDITPQPEIEQQDLTSYVRHLDTEHAEQIVLDGTYDGQDVEDKEVFVQHDGKLVGFNKTLNPGGDWGTSTMPSHYPVPQTKGVYGNGIILLAENQASVLRSQDKGLTWEWRSINFYPAGGYFGTKCFLYDGTRFVFQRGGTTRFSEDGVTFQSAQTNLSNSYETQGFEYGNGVYVVSVNNGCVYYSYDAITWTEATQMNKKYAALSCFANGKFFALTSSKAYTSENGIDWVESSKPNGSGYQCAGGNGVFVNVLNSGLDNSSNEIQYSTDGGITWVRSWPVSRRLWSGLSWCGDRFFMVSHKENIYAYSFDGINWVEGALPTTANWSTVTYVDGTIVVTTSDKTNVAYASFQPFYEYSLTDLSFNKAEVEENYALKSDIPPEIDTSKFLQNQAQSADSVELGSLSTTDQQTVDIGYGSKSTSWYSVGVGYGTKAYNTKSVSVGHSATSWENCVSVGYNARSGGSSGASCVAIGANTYAKSASVVIGCNAKMSSDSTTQSNAVLIGYNAQITGQRNNTIAIGANAITNSNNSVQMGAGTNVNHGTFQFRNWTLVDANGNIPAERLGNVPKTTVSISTEEQALAGVDDTTAMSPLKTLSVIADNVGRGVQLGFNGTLSEGVLTFEVPSENAGEYTLKHLYNYEIDLLFEAVGQLDDSTQIVIKNGAQNINIVNAKHDNHKTPVTVGDMKQIMKYSTDIGFRWIFDARYTVTTDGQPVFVMPSTVTNSPTTQDGVTVFEGDNHPVVIKGQAGTTATGLQVQDSLQAGSAVDFEHYRSGDQYGIQFTVDNSKATTGNTQYWRSYVTDAGVSVTDFTTQQNVLVPTEALTTIGNNAASTQWVKDYIDSRLAELG